MGSERATIKNRTTNFSKWDCIRAHFPDLAKPVVWIKMRPLVLTRSEIELYLLETRLEDLRFKTNLESHIDKPGGIQGRHQPNRNE